MANYQALKTAIQNAVYENGNNEITGQGLQDVLTAIVNSLGAGFQFAGIATVETDPGTPDQNVVYIAGSGTFVNFGGTVVKPGSLGIFSYNGTWSYSVVDINTLLAAYININEIANHPDGYASAAEALADVPLIYRRTGVKVVYLDDNTYYWIEMLCVDDAGMNWWTDVANNWIIEGPIETHIPTATGGQQLRIAGQRRGNLDDLLNVNVWNNKATSYDDAASARAAVPANKRKLGLNITYLLYIDENTEKWVNEQFIGDNLSDNWADDANWQSIGKDVTVSQNTLIIDGEEKGELAGQIINNPVWIKIVTDSENKILYGIKSDGQFYFGAGVPEQVKEYIEPFLDSINRKVDKEDGKGLIPLQYIRELQTVNYLQLSIDAESKILSYCKIDGSHWFNDLHSQTIDTNSEDIAALKRINYRHETFRPIFERFNLTNTGDIAKITESRVNTFRTSKFIAATGTILQTNPTNSQIVLYEYDKYFNYIQQRNINSNIEYALHGNTLYVKLMAETANWPNVTITTYTNPLQKYFYNKRINGNEISFAYEVTPNEGRDVTISDPNIIQYTTDVYYNGGLLMLPPNYSHNGEPVRLVIFCHGSGDYLHRTDLILSQYYEDYIHWLRDEGFAIMDCFGHSSKYNSVSGWAGVDEINCIVNAYNWVVNNYNIRRDGVHLGCKSQGGLVALSLCYNRGIPVLSCGMLAPAVCQIVNRATAIFGYNAENDPVTGVNPTRQDFVNDMQFVDVDNITSDCLNGAVWTQNRTTYVLGNIDKLIGWNPFICGMSKEDAIEIITTLMEDNPYSDVNWPKLLKPRRCDIPVKIWVASDDSSFAIYAQSYSEIQGIKNGGGVGILRRMPTGTGGHHAVDTDPNALKVATIMTDLGVTYQNIPLAWVEMWQWFKQHN